MRVSFIFQKTKQKTPTMALTGVLRHHAFRTFKGTTIPEQLCRTQCTELHLTMVNYVCHIHYTRPPRIHHIRKTQLSTGGWAYQPATATALYRGSRRPHCSWCTVITRVRGMGCGRLGLGRSTGWGQSSRPSASWGLGQVNGPGHVQMSRFKAVNGESLRFATPVHHKVFVPCLQNPERALVGRV